MSIKAELNARAKFKEGDRVWWSGKRYTVWTRFWRRSEDAFYYDLREIPTKGSHLQPQMPRKVPEEQLTD